MQAVFGEAANEVVNATRAAARRHQGLAIAVDFNALDKRIVAHIVSSQANFVRDEYGRRREAFASEARRIVADGLESGLSREDIARDLERAAQTVLAARSSFYWEVLASAFVSRGLCVSPCLVVFGQHDLSRRAPLFQPHRECFPAPAWHTAQIVRYNEPYSARSRLGRAPSAPRLLRGGDLHERSPATPRLPHTDGNGA